MGICRAGWRGVYRAAKIGCAPRELHKWTKTVAVDAGRKPGVTTEVTGRMKALEREVREMRQANEILRKASAYFAQAELDRPFRPTAAGSERDRSGDSVGGIAPDPDPIRVPVDMDKAGASDRSPLACHIVAGRHSRPDQPPGNACVEAARHGIFRVHQRRVKDPDFKIGIARFPSPRTPWRDQSDPVRVQDVPVGLEREQAFAAVDHDRQLFQPAVKQARGLDLAFCEPEPTADAIEGRRIDRKRATQRRCLKGEPAVVATQADDADPAIPSVGWPANGSSTPSEKMRTR